MNCIILEGIGLWIAVILVVLLLTVLLVSLLCVVWSDKKITSLEAQLRDKDIKLSLLLRKNFLLNLKYGEFDIDG
ncbi:MAG: hypothetical protein IKL46_05915 [Clostridia bacterium]|nr:hypothetical protein [Clostridia bacterium]